MSITQLTVRGGTAPWVDTVIEWQGVATTWTLTNTATSTVLYTGPLTRYQMVSVPETIYFLRLSDGAGAIQDIAYVSPPISAPVELVAKDVTDTSATLAWVAVEGATAYEVLVDETSYNVLPPPPPVDEGDPTYPNLALGNLEPDRTYSAQNRAFMDTTGSLWSPVIYFTTERTTVAEASQYEYPPSVARTYNPSGWLPDGNQLIHGSGADFGNVAGIHTTVFLYSADSLRSLRELAGVRVLTAQVSITRFPAESDPRMVMSHWLLHDMDVIPAGAPTFVAPAMGVDSGQVALSQQAWMSIPTGWIDSMIAGTAEGFGWGGVAGRYMLAHPISDPIRPANGTLRITVG